MADETRINKTVDELSEELKIIELQQKISEAKKSTLKAILPDSELKALEGKHTLDDNVAIECKILTYRAMSEIAFQISKEIKNTTEKSKEIKNTTENICVERVIIYNQDDFNIVLLYKTFIRQAQLLINQYKVGTKEVIKPSLILTKELFPSAERRFFVPLPMAALTAVSAVPAVLKSFVDIASIFRTDTDIKGKKTEIVDEAVVAEIVRALNSVGITTIYPVFMNKISDKVLGDLLKLSELKRNADTKIEEWSTNEDFVDKIVFLKNLNMQYETILAGLVCVDEKTGINRLETLIKGEILSTELDKDNTYVLYLKVVDGGGNNKVTQNLLHSRLSHSGGAIMTYFLLSKEGVIKTSKTLYNITGYTELKNSGSIDPLNNF